MQIPDVSDAELRFLIEDTRTCIIEDAVDFEKNPKLIGMKHFFRGFSFKAYKCTEID